MAEPKPDLRRRSRGADFKLRHYRDFEHVHCSRYTFRSFRPALRHPRSVSGVDSETEKAMHISKQLRQEKLAKILAAEGYDDIAELAQEALLGSRAGTPSICMNERCNYICEMEPDQERGWCKDCGTNSMMSGLVLAELI